MIRATLLALLPFPALAQDVTDEAALLDAFAARCAEISADPRGAVNALVGAEAEGRTGAMTSDGAVAQLTEPGFGMDGADGVAGADGADGAQSIFSFYQTVVAGRARRSCTLTVFGTGDGGADGGALADMASVAAVRAPDLLGGPATQAGGPVMAGGELGQMLLWHLAEGGADGPVLSLGQDERALALGLGRVEPAP